MKKKSIRAQKFSFAIVEGASISDAISAIDAGGKQIAAVLAESGELIGVLTDGDIRRALLGGAGLDTSISAFIKTEFVCVEDRSSASENLNIMKKNAVHHLPVLDDKGVLMKLEFLDDLLQESLLNVDVVLMAGGRGARLMPLTQDCPKPMLRIGGKPILEITVRDLVSQGLTNITISVNYLRKQIVDYFEDGARFGANISYLEEAEPLGTAGALRFFAPMSNDVLVMNGDVLSSVDFRGLVAFHRKYQAACTVCVRNHATRIPYGVVNLNDGLIEGVTEKPLIEHYVNAGIYMLASETVDTFKPDGHKDMTEIISELINKGHKVAGFPVHEEWFDIGDLTELSRARGILT